MLSAPLAPSFDDPLALLCACHDKVRRFAGLTVRLRQHVREHGRDADARRAAADILRYFEQAAPLHHADEEDDLFPALRTLDDGALNAELDALEAEHGELAGLWSGVRAWLRGLIDEEAIAEPPLLEQFAQCYPAHADREEAVAYVAAQRLAPEVLQALGRQMAARRGTVLPHA